MSLFSVCSRNRLLFHIRKFKIHQTPSINRFLHGRILYPPRLHKPLVVLSTRRYYQNYSYENIDANAFPGHLLGGAGLILCGGWNTGNLPWKFMSAHSLCLHNGRVNVSCAINKTLNF